MADVIRLNYPAMQEMARHCKKTAARLMETARLAQSIAQQMQNGALVGDAGEAFSGALTGAFNPSVTRLSQKFEEVARDIEGAIQDMQDADAGKAASLFK
jgi:WXG100 family type VII secretion target